MKITKKILMLLAAAATPMMFSCDPEDIVSDLVGDSELEVTLNGLDDLTGSPYVYEGWLLIDGTPQSTGRFTKAADASFSFDGIKAATATKYILTVEPATGDVPEPSELKVMAADIIGSTGAISTATAPALGSGVDFTGSKGVYLVAAPTSNMAAGFENSGIWFLDASKDPHEAGLTLPTLGADFVYEGWVVVDGVPLSTGTFTSVTGADNESPFSDSGPAFPGEDFVTDAPSGVTFPLNVNDLNVVISVEPANDLDPAPFFIKPLVRGDAESGTLNLNTLPSGTISFK